MGLFLKETNKKSEIIIEELKEEEEIGRQLVIKGKLQEVDRQFIKVTKYIEGETFHFNEWIEEYKATH